MLSLMRSSGLTSVRRSTKKVFPMTNTFKVAGTTSWQPAIDGADYSRVGSGEYAVRRSLHRSVGACCEP
ncbi:hypothetical protein J2T09_005552 [Neorhizobium huautlense]|uniref:Uncharacterized protein n=1 Tax=Neorhizobium huautlense TaxID=67774 RepID=A0ABT9Q206_9HYPH|nr:hypothetical protein [Neorhizobium huautlense]